MGETEKGPPKSLLKPLQKVQTACLRSITGGYKRTATALLEKEANIPPLQLYIEAAAMERAQKERNSNITKYIKTRLNKLWRDPRVPRRRANQIPQSREDISEKQVKKAEEEWCRVRAQAHIEEEGRRARGQQRQQQERERGQSRAQKSTGKPSTAIQHWLDQHWRGAWESKVQKLTQAKGTQAIAWSTPWGVNTQRLREGLTKAESTMATLLRTGVIGLKDWLYWVGVPVGSPRCECGWPRQTLKYVILLYPLRTNQEAMLSVAGTENYNTLLSTQKGLKAVTQWLISQNVLDQFRVVKEMVMEGKGASNRCPLMTLQ